MSPGPARVLSTHFLSQVPAHNVNAGLFLLSLRRAASPVVLAWWAALVLILVLQDRSAAGLALDAQSSGADAGALARGMLREGVWSGFCLGIVPLLVLRAARTIGDWRKGEVDWLASRATGRATILASTWLGALSTCAALAALTLAAIEARAGASGSSLREAGRLSAPAEGWFEGARPLTWTVADPRAPPGSRARIELGLGSGSGASSEVLLAAWRASPPSAGRTDARVRIASRGAIEIELPSGSGDLVLSLACADPGARACLLSDTVELWSPARNEREASLAILMRILAALFAWTAIAIGAGAWVSAPIVFLGLAAAWIPFWLSESPVAWLPGADIASAIAVAGEGRVPAPADASSWAATAILSLLGLALGAWGLGTWRRET